MGVGAWDWHAWNREGWGNLCNWRRVHRVVTLQKRVGEWRVARTCLADTWETCWHVLPSGSSISSISSLSSSFSCGALPCCCLIFCLSRLCAFFALLTMPIDQNSGVWFPSLHYNIILLILLCTASSPNLSGVEIFLLCRQFGMEKVKELLGYSSSDPRQYARTLTRLCTQVEGRPAQTVIRERTTEEWQHDTEHDEEFLTILQKDDHRVLRYFSQVRMLAREDLHPAMVREEKKLLSPVIWLVDKCPLRLYHQINPNFWIRIVWCTPSAMS